MTYALGIGKCSCSSSNPEFETMSLVATMREFKLLTQAGDSVDAGCDTIGAVIYLGPSEVSEC